MDMCPVLKLHFLVCMFHGDVPVLKLHFLVCLFHGDVLCSKVTLLSVPVSRICALFKSYTSYCICFMEMCPVLKLHFFQGILLTRETMVCAAA